MNTGKRESHLMNFNSLGTKNEGILTIAFDFQVAPEDVLLTECIKGDFATL